MKMISHRFAVLAVAIALQTWFQPTCASKLRRGDSESGKPLSHHLHTLLRKKAERAARRHKTEATVSAEFMLTACDTSTPPANGVLGDCVSMLASGSTCSPSCNVGYTVSGVHSCYDGTLAAATCGPSSCVVRAPDNGTLGTCPRTLSSEGGCTPTCNAGFTVIGETSCKLGALNLATCTPSPCATVAPQNGNVGSCPGQLSHGGSCSPGCNAGYSVSGLSMCLYGSFSSASCIPSPCDTSQGPLNGGIGDCPPQIAHGTTCQPTCNEGYTASGTSLCHLGLLVPAICYPSSCKVRAPGNGTIGDCPSTMTHGATCSPTCNVGFSVSGSSSCSLGKLSAATCSISSCSVTAPDNGHRGSCPPVLAHGTSCSPTCNAGFTLQGLSRCTYGSLSSAVCSPDSCDVAAPEHGNIGSCPKLLQHGGTCVPACATGYRVSGISSCTFGNFSSAACVPSPCLSQAPANGNFGTCLGQLNDGETCQPVCNAGYTVSGASSCSLGKLTLAVCNPNTCTTSAPVNGVRGQCQGVLNHGGVCYPYCNPGYTRTGVSTCDNGTFTSTTCVPSDCTVTAPVYGTLGNCSSSLAHGSSCQPSCNFGYRPSGPTTCAKGAIQRTVCETEIRVTRNNNGNFFCSAYCGYNTNNELSGWGGACCLSAVDTSGRTLSCTATSTTPVKCSCLRNDATPFATGLNATDDTFVCPQVAVTTTDTTTSAAPAALKAKKRASRKKVVVEETSKEVETEEPSEEEEQSAEDVDAEQ